MATKDDIRKLLAECMVIWPNFQPDAAALGLIRDVWHGIMADVDYAPLSLAVRKLGTEREFCPPPGVIRKTAVMLAHPPIPTPLQGWKAVRDAIDAHAYAYGDDIEERIMAAVHSANPFAAEAVDALGLRGVYRMNADDEPSWRARFIEEYKAVVSNAVDAYTELPAVREYRARLPHHAAPQLSAPAYGGSAGE